MLTKITRKYSDVRLFFTNGVFPLLLFVSRRNRPPTVPTPESESLNPRNKRAAVVRRRNIAGIMARCKRVYRHDLWMRHAAPQGFSWSTGGFVEFMTAATGCSLTGDMVQDGMRRRGIAEWVQSEPGINGT